jgi:hypothetical protein
MLLGFIQPDILLDHVCTGTLLSVETVPLQLFRSPFYIAESVRFIVSLPYL